MVDGKQIIFEFNGCAYHSCERCKNVRVSRNEDARKLFFRNLQNTKIVEIASCEWYAEKCENEMPESDISPLLYQRVVHSNDIFSLIMEGKLYGFCVVDIEKGYGAEKWAQLNWPPLMQKDEILYDDIPDWMKPLFEESEFPKTTIVQKMSAKKLLLHTDLLRFYINNGFMLTCFHKFYEYQGSECFKNVYQRVYEARVEATEIVANQNATDEEKKLAEKKATAVKLVSNSMYGSLLLVS